MKKNIIVIIGLVFLLITCKESITTPQDNSKNSNYFPISNGNYYQYIISIYDSTGLIQSGVKKCNFNGDTVLLLTSYQAKIDSFEINNVVSVNQSYFRKSPTGIFNYVGIDTTGFSGLVPDSLQSGISFDTEYRMIYAPLSLNQTWPVYKVRVDLIYTEFELFKIDAEVITRDSVTLSLQNTTLIKDVYKIKYKATLINGLNSIPIRFEAFCWIADGIGIIKWEGDTELINFFTGTNIYPAESTVIEELFSYKIN
jgi:hypothetical protein